MIVLDVVHVVFMDIGQNLIKLTQDIPRKICEHVFVRKILGTSFIKLLTILVLNLLLTSGAKAGCDDAPTDGVDYSNCQFSEGQDLSLSLIHI